MPPTQWLKLRQYSIPCDMASTSLSIDAPVVVKPDTISNNASTNEGISPDSQKGRQPNRLITIQLSPTHTSPSRANMPIRALRHRKYSITPTLPVSAVHISNTIIA